ncbi:MAG: hypothetical protein ACREOO_04780 [bacterium]
MQEQLQIRLHQLTKEFETGQARLRELDMQQTHLRETLLRISGAIQVLQELMDGEQGRHEKFAASDNHVIQPVMAQ